MSNIAVVNSSAGSIHIGGPADFVPLSLTVSKPGLYLVFARVVIQNDDRDPQNASARISHDEEFIIDRVDVRIAGGARTSISLQGTLRVDSRPQRVNLRCITFNGSASQSSIFAVEVSEFRFS